ncbi:hypothetical protein ACTFR8_24260 [Bacillus cereus group sp. MYBK15-3]|uniref:hypothetical protein n=1 Tax=Bacillus cereus group TaxID=86661 RepID=UPI001C8BD4BB|nr:hypothetical protein [Bacillus cereus]MBX9158713.1 hypothetical protein [Bacillus cereus]
MKGKLIGHQVDSLITVQYESEEDKLAGVTEFKAKGFHALEPFVKDGVHTVSYAKKEFRSVDEGAELEGEPLFWSLNGSFGTMKGIRALIEKERIKSIQELYAYGERHLELLHEDMVKVSPLPVTIKNKEDEK